MRLILNFRDGDAGGGGEKEGAVYRRTGRPILVVPKRGGRWDARGLSRRQNRRPFPHDPC